jgi:acyl-[acyl-carrier-protein]-phospholipid O-acyltransferase / long-chain-fatty-acid--[acyl-carrier-protein] ligase
MIARLAASPSFVPLFWCQFCSALNDNFLKNALGMLLLVGMARSSSSSGLAYADVLITLSGIVFIAPYFILSALGGELADRYDKGYVAQRVKLFEIPVAVAAAVGFYLHSIPILFLALAGFGVIGALFGPMKYAILPERLAAPDVPAGNAVIEAATFLAILLGTITGGLAITQADTPAWVAGVILVLAVVTWLFARAIPYQGPAAPGLIITRNVWTSTRALLADIGSVPRLWVGALITSWFWLTGSVALALLPPLIKQRLGAPDAFFTVCLAMFTIGIAVGSAVAARTRQGRPNLRLVPVGAALMGVASLAAGLIAGLAAADSTFASIGAVALAPTGFALLGTLFVLAVGGGIFIVPAFAAVQGWSAPARRARVIAAVNVLNAAAMVAGGATLAALQALGVGAPVLFSLLGAACLSVAVVVARIGFATWNEA